MTVLSKLGWSMGATTPLHFLGYYLSKGVVFEDDLMQGKALVEKVPRYVQKYAEFFADLCLQDYDFQRYPPSLLSAAILTASRKALHVSPLWRPELTALTGTAESEMAPVMEHLWRHYLDCFPQAWTAKAPSPSGVQEFSSSGAAKAAAASVAVNVSAQ